MIGVPMNIRLGTIDPEGGMAPDDAVRMIIRWNGVQPGSKAHAITKVGDIPVDTWFQVD